MNELQKRLAENVAAIRAKMERAARAAGRQPEEVLLCAASKTQPAEKVLSAAGCNIDIFGENYVQELVEKSDANAYAGKPLHLIGHLQTNKVKYVVGRAELIQSVDSAKLLAAISREAEKKKLCQDFLIEVNIGEEESKTGLRPESVFSLAELAESLPAVRLRGLMAIPPVNDDDQENRRALRKMFKLYRELSERGYAGAQMDTLSMGMSGDYENAILEGATIVRIGTAIFGARSYPNRG